MVVKAAQQEVDGQTQPQLALRDQPRRQRGDTDRLRGAPTAVGVFGSDRLFADELGGNVFVFGGNFLADLLSRLLTVATGLILRLQHHALHLQLHRRQRVSSGATLFFESFLIRVRPVGLEHVLAYRGWPLRLLFEIPRHLSQLFLLLGGKLVRLGTEELAFELRNIGSGFS